VVAGRHADKEAGFISRLAIGCGFHRCASIQTKTFDFMKGDISGMLALAIAQRNGGRFEAFRQAIGDLVLSKLRIVRGKACSEEARIHRKRLLDLCLPSGHMVSDEGGWIDGAVRRECCRIQYEACFNGDIRDGKHIWHHVEENGPTDDEIKTMMYESAPLALAPALLPHFPRHRWTGSRQVFCSVTLFANTHNLLSQVLTLWVGSDGGDVAKAKGNLLLVRMYPRSAPSHTNDGGRDKDITRSTYSSGVLKQLGIHPTRYRRAHPITCWKAR
jgi:hypothetical protein